METRNTGNVIGGHKANISNPHTSRESKQRSEQVLSELGNETATSSSSGNNNSGGGTQPLSSSAAAAATRNNLDETGVNDGTVEGAGGRRKNKGNVIGGYKATLRNPNMTEEAKGHAQEALEQLGDTQ